MRWAKRQKCEARLLLLLCCMRLYVLLRRFVVQYMVHSCYTLWYVVLYCKITRAARKSVSTWSVKKKSAESDYIFGLCLTKILAS